MISLKTLIVEGRYDALVTKLSRELLSVIKLSHSAATQSPNGEFAGRKIYFKDDVPNIESPEYPEIYFREVENESIPVEFYLTLKIQWIEGLGGLRKGGDAYNDTEDHITDDGAPPLIEIRLELDPELYPNILSEVAMNLRDTLRHEIEHITQSGWNLKSGKYIKSDVHLRKKIESGELPAFRYFILPKEIDANIQGLYLYAKKSKIPFAQAVNEYLDDFVPNFISEQEKELIIGKWKERLPALGIRQEL